MPRSQSCGVEGASQERSPCYACGMSLQPEDVRRLDDRAREVGKKIGWALGFVVAPNPEYVGLVAGPERVFVIGPKKLADLAAHEIDLGLDALERGDRQILPDEDGDPQLI